MGLTKIRKYGYGPDRCVKKTLRRIAEASEINVQIHSRESVEALVKLQHIAIQM